MTLVAGGRSWSMKNDRKYERIQKVNVSTRIIITKYYVNGPRALCEEG